MSIKISYDRFNPYFTGLPILICWKRNRKKKQFTCFNPYFTGLPILIVYTELNEKLKTLFQSLFYWITYSYISIENVTSASGLVSILILLDYLFLFSIYWIKTGCYLCFNPYFTGLPILISIYNMEDIRRIRFQSLFYWITYSYNLLTVNLNLCGFVSILILLDYLFL